MNSNNTIACNRKLW